MAGSRIDVARLATFPDALEVIPPVRAGLVGLFYLQGVADKARRNLAPAKFGTRATVIGSPTFTGTGMQNPGASATGLQTDLPETEEFTWLLAMSTSASLSGSANQPNPLGTFNGSSGASMWFRDPLAGSVPAARLTGQAYDDTNTQAHINIADVSVPNLYAVRVSAAGVIANNLTEGVQSSLYAMNAPRVFNHGRNIRIGCSHSLSLIGANICNLAMMYDRALPDDELDEVHAFLSPEMGDYGITI